MKKDSQTPLSPEETIASAEAELNLRKEEFEELEEQQKTEVQAIAELHDELNQGVYRVDEGDQARGTVNEYELGVLEQLLEDKRVELEEMEEEAHEINAWCLNALSETEKESIAEVRQEVAHLIAMTEELHQEASCLFEKCEIEMNVETVGSRIEALSLLIRERKDMEERLGGLLPLQNAVDLESEITALEQEISDLETRIAEFEGQMEIFQPRPLELDAEVEKKLLEMSICTISNELFTVFAPEECHECETIEVDEELQGEASFVINAFSKFEDDLLGNYEKPTLR